MKAPVILGDLRNLSIPSDRYGLATYISTIEHIGFNSLASTGNKNTAFERAVKPEDVATVRDSDANIKVLNQFHRALETGELLLISCKGRGGPVLSKDSLDYFCAQWEYDESSWSEITSHPSFELVEEMFSIRTLQNLWYEVNGPAELASQISYLRPHADGCALASLRAK